MNRSVLSYLRAATFTFSRGFAHPPPTFCISHSHAHHEVVYHEKGRGTVLDTTGGRARFREHDIVIHPAGIAHEQAMERPGNDVCVQFKVTPDLPPPLARMIHVPAIKDPVIHHECMSLCRMPFGLPPARKLECSHRVAALYTRLLDESGLIYAKREETVDRYAAAAREYVQQNASAIESIEDVANAVGISYDHLRHVFKKQYAMSIKRWHLEVRVERAKELLANTSIPAKRISSMCGFATERYFSTNFKKLAGVTPGEYRREASH